MRDNLCNVFVVFVNDKFLFLLCVLELDDDVFSSFFSFA